MSPNGRVRVHPRSERWSVLGAALLMFLLTTPLFQSPPFSLSTRAAALVGVLVAGMAWWSLDALLTRRRGLLLRIGWSGRGRTLELEVIRGWRRLAALRIPVLDYHGETACLTTPELKAALTQALHPYAQLLSQADPLHIVGLTDDDASIFVRLIREAAQTA
jgi:hypothetical protein